MNSQLLKGMVLVLSLTAISSTANAVLVNSISIDADSSASSTGFGSTMCFLSPDSKGCSSTDDSVSAEAWISSAGGVLDFSTETQARNNIFSTSSSVSFSLDVTNDSAAPQQHYLPAFFKGGYFYVGFEEEVTQGDAGVNAGYEVDIKVNGTSIWNSSFWITKWSRDGFGSSLSMLLADKLGPCNGGTSDCWSEIYNNDPTLFGFGSDQFSPTGSYSTFYDYFIQPQLQNILLGLFQPGESYLLEYNMEVWTSNSSTGDNIMGVAGAYLADPFMFEGQPLPSVMPFLINSEPFALPPESVPEPTTLALICLGLAGVGFARGKKQS